MKKYNKEHFTVEYQYQEFLKVMELDETKMSAIERMERKHTFMGAYGQSLLMLKQLANIPSDDGLEIINGLFDQVNDYFKKAAEDLMNKNS